MIRNKPNLFIVGAAKAGTTSLYHYLSQHPEVYMCPIKEPNYFSKDIDPDKIRPEILERSRLLKIDSFIKSDMKKPIHRAFIRDEEKYFSLFRFANNEKVIGEASASYLYSNVAAKNIYQFNPDAKIIIILRNPIRRMYSHYLMDRRMAITQLSFEDAILKDKKNPNKTWGSKSLYFELGEYYEQVKRYYDVFPSSNIFLMFSNELQKDAATVVKNIYHFLNIDTTFIPDINYEFNPGVVPRNIIISKIIANNYLRIKVRQNISNKLIKQFIKKLLFKKPANENILEETQRELIKYYSEDIHKLSKLINRDLSKWEKIN